MHEGSNYIDIHDNEVVNLNIDKATVTVDDEEKRNENQSSTEYTVGENEAGERVYTFNNGTEQEVSLEWKQEEDGLSRQNPPFMLEGDILSYVKEIDSILNVTKGDNLEIVEKRYRGLNNVLARMVEENEGYVWEIEVKCSEGEDCFINEFGRTLEKVGIESSFNTLERLLPTIKRLVDCECGYAMIKGEAFCIRDWWLKEGKYNLYPGVAVLYMLWRILDNTIEEMHHLFEKIGHKVEDVIPAYATYRMMERFKDGEAIMQYKLNHPVYTVTGVRYQMGDNLSDDERTAAAERFLAGLKRGQRVLLMAEPDNPFDPRAIAAYINYEPIGYIARENTDEVSALLDSNGQCDAVVEQTDGHVTFFISIPGAQEKSIVGVGRPRQLPESPLGEGVRMPFTDDERTLQLIATQLIKKKVTAKNVREIIRLTGSYIPFRKLSICYEDTVWRDKISKMLYRILYASRFPTLLREQERKLAEILYVLVSRAIGDMRSTIEHWPEQVFIEHLDRLRDNERINKFLYEKYCNEFLDGKDFADADKALATKEYERLCDWLKKMKWKELRDPDDLQRMGLKIYNLGLSRQELYDLYGVLLIIERLREATATPDNKIDNISLISQNKYDLLSDSRKAIVDELLTLAEKGDWVEGIKVDDIKKMLTTVLGVGEMSLTAKHAVLSNKLWTLLEKGRKGDNGRVRIRWENIVGFLDEKGLLRQKGTPALDKDFFGDSKGYTNIDKGRPGHDNMSEGFREILPLLDAFAPKLPKR